MSFEFEEAPTLGGNATLPPLQDESLSFHVNLNYLIETNT